MTGYLNTETYIFLRRRLKCVVIIPNKSWFLRRKKKLPHFLTLRVIYSVQYGLILGERLNRQIPGTRVARAPFPRPLEYCRAMPAVEWRPP